MDKRPVVTTENFLRSGARFRLNLSLQRSVRRTDSRAVDGGPGARLGRFAQLIVGPRIAEAQIDPCIADMQHEYFEAVERRDKPAAWSALFRGSVAVLAHVLRNISGFTHRFQRTPVSALNMPERFSEESRVVGQMAYDHARRLRQDYVGVDCLLLALMDHPRTDAMMEQCGANVDAIRAAVARRILPELAATEIPDVLPLGSGLGHAWLEAHWEANTKRSYWIEPEHLLRALIRDKSMMSKAAKDLIAAGFALLALVCVSAPANAQSGARPEPRTITLPRANATIKEKFSSVGSVRELLDGRVIVTDNRDNLVYIADFVGSTSARQLGRHGKGPGEYEQVGRLWPLRGDSTLMLEPMGQRGIILSGSEVAITLTATSPLLKSVGRPLSIFLGRDAKGAVLAQVLSFGKGAPNPADSMLLIRAHASAPDVDTLSRVSSVLQMPGTSATSSVGAEGGGARGNARYPVNLRWRDQSALFPDGAVAIVRANPYRVDWCMPNGGCRPGVAIEPAGNGISDETKEAIILWQSRTSMVLTGRHASETTGWPAVLPAFIVGGKFDDTAVLPEPRGNLVVERIPTASPVVSPYDLLDRSGRRIAVLRLEMQQRVVGFGKSSVYTVDIDKDGLQSLQRHDWKY